MVFTLSVVYGLLIGSFLNVVIWRVPRKESLVSPPSHCPRCDRRLSVYENVPVLSWLALRGRCRTCKKRISARYPLVELATGALFGGLVLRLDSFWALPAYFYLAAACVALALIDLDTKKLPDVITLPSYAVGIVLLGMAALGEGEGGPYVRALIGMAALFAIYFLLVLAYPAGMGFGDVKLAGVLGMYLAYLGWAEWFTGWLLGFMLGGVFGVLALVVGKATRKTKVPYGPFMIAGALIAVFWGGAIADTYLGLNGL